MEKTKQLSMIFNTVMGEEESRCETNSMRRVHRTDVHPMAKPQDGGWEEEAMRRKES